MQTKQSDPAVQLAHQRIAKSQRRESDSHADNVLFIRQGKDAKGLVAKGNPKAKQDADALASYEPAKGHVAIGHLPGRPTEEQAIEISKAQRKQAKGKPLTDKELDAIADRDVSHVGTRKGWEDSDIEGHRYLVHNKMTGRNEIFSDAELRSRSDAHKKSFLGSPDAPSHLIPTRQFNSQGVEVELNHHRFIAQFDSRIAVKNKGDFKQLSQSHSEERAAFPSAKRAKFGTSQAKS